MNPVGHRILKQICLRECSYHKYAALFPLVKIEARKAHYLVSRTVTATFAAGCHDQPYRMWRSDPIIQEVSRDPYLFVSEGFFHNMTVSVL